MTTVLDKYKQHTHRQSQQPRIVLTQEEREYARAFAYLRQGWSRKTNLHDARPLGSGAMDPDIVGAYGEFAVHKWLNIPWEPNPEIPGYDGDVLGNIEIKTTIHSAGRLLARPFARGNQALLEKMRTRIFLLVTWHDSRSEATIVGWAHGKEFLIDANWGNPFGNDRNDAWTLPQDQLKSPMELSGHFK